MPAAPHSSRGLGHRPLKAEITGSNPVCGTTGPPTPDHDPYRAVRRVRNLDVFHGIGQVFLLRDSAFITRAAADRIDWLDRSV